jgi:hypothetical protein
LAGCHCWCYFDRPGAWIFSFYASHGAAVHDPAALMQTVGTIAGAAIGISAVMIVLGLIGKEA